MIPRPIASYRPIYDRFHYAKTDTVLTTVRSIIVSRSQILSLATRDYSGV